MNIKVLLILSLLANVALGVLAFRKPAEPPPAAAPVEAKVQSGSVFSKPAVKVVEQTVTNTVVKRFNWQSVESPDYKEYIANLRAVGCPEETIKDIIIADVNKLYEEKKRQVRGEPKRYEFWKPGNPFLGSMNSELMDKMRALDEEKDNVLRALGIEPDFKTQVASMMNPLDTMFDFLPEDKKARLLKLMTDMQGKMAKAMEDGGRPDPEQIQKAQKEMEQAVKQMLTPEEAMDFDLRMSMTANMMRMQMAGWEPDEQEFLDVFKLRKSFDDEYSPISRGNETDEQRKSREAAEKQLKEQIKQKLGPEEYARYERGQDWAYQQMYQATKKAGVGAEAANQVYDIKKVAEEQARNIRNDSNLSQDQKNEALQAIRAETEKTLPTIMGDAWEPYSARSANMNWLDGISRRPKSTGQ